MRRANRARAAAAAARGNDDDTNDLVDAHMTVGAQRKPDGDNNVRDEEADDPEALEAPEGGLASRRRMHESYQITSQNDVARRGGQRDAFLTVRGAAFPIRTVRVSFASWLGLMGGWST